MVSGAIVHRVSEIQAEPPPGKFKARLWTGVDHQILAYNHQIPLDK
jgi:hypothetical protein